MRSLTNGEVKSIEFEILCKFSAFCEENSLTYMLCGGTLLGAVRHGGFIPWDDDIDVLMPRPDYEKLLNEVNLEYNSLGTSVEMWHWKNGKLNYPFIKFVDNRTCIKGKYIRKDMDVGKVWIDVFPLDGNPSDMRKTKELYKKVKIYRRLLMLKLAKSGEGKTLLKKLLKPAAIFILKPVSAEWLCRKIDELSKTCDYGEAAYAGGILWGYGTCERMEKVYYERLIKLKFEGNYFNVPEAYDEYLTNLYGNYWELPSVREREVGHSFQAYFE